MSEVPVLDLWQAQAAGRLLLHRPDDAGLARLVEPLLTATGTALDPDTPEPLTLSGAIDTAANLLFQWLEDGDPTTPLGRIAAYSGMDDKELDLLGLATLPCLEEDGALAVAALGGGERRLRLGLALKILYKDSQDAKALRWRLRGSPLWRLGLLRMPPDEVGPLEARLDPTPALLAALDGAEAERIGRGWTARWVMYRGQVSRHRQDQATRLLELAEAGAVHLVGPAAAAESVLALAGEGQGAVVYEAPAGDAGATPPWAEARLVGIASGRLVALRSEAITLPAPPSNVRAVPLLAPSSFHLQGGDGALSRLEVGSNDPLELSAAWEQELGVPQEEADRLAGRTWLSPRLVQDLASGLDATPPEARVTAALERIARQTPPRAAGLAVRRQPVVTWDRMVLAPDTKKRLEELVDRVERRVTVQQRWGLGNGERGCGVVGLLHGESGTGKTLAADAIATRLHLPMLAVDLSLVVSKYIGETEKNLAQVFDAAEGFAALLFFDEADALFGRRTGVRDAHDRYANIEVNYLLQRLEVFEGLALLSTNLLQGMDDAFLRRFDQMVAFRRPGITDRLKIWKQHLPSSDHLASDVDLKLLARLYDITGGEIRNAALTAAYEAAAAGRPIAMTAVVAAVEEEYGKKGQPVPSLPP